MEAASTIRRFGCHFFVFDLACFSDIDSFGDCKLAPRSSDNCMRTRHIWEGLSGGKTFRVEEKTTLSQVHHSLSIDGLETASSAGCWRPFFSRVVLISETDTLEGEGEVVATVSHEAWTPRGYCTVTSNGQHVYMGVQQSTWFSMQPSWVQTLFIVAPIFVSDVFSDRWTARLLIILCFFAVFMVLDTIRVFPAHTQVARG